MSKLEECAEEDFKKISGRTVEKNIFFVLFFLYTALIEVSFIKSLNFNADKKNPIIFLVSIPKCGTHLLEKYMFSLIARHGRWNDKNSITEEDLYANITEFFLISHSICTEKEVAFVTDNNMLGAFIYRDPRDQIISMIHYIKKNPKYFARDFLHINVKDMTLDQLIYVCIDMLPSMYVNRLAWITSPRVYTTTFEKLIGSRGGGSDEQQFEEFRNIAHHFNIILTDQQIVEKAKNLFGGTWTFREGKIGSWKHYFTEEHKKYFKARANRLLIDLGYERDAYW